MNVINLKDRTTASQYVAIELLKQIKSQPNAVLGLATGSTMIDIYKYLAELINVNHTKLSDVVTFNLDEYIGLAADHEQSYHAYMKENLFNHNSTWNEDNIYLPKGDAEDVEKECIAYEQCIQDAGPADVQILGIGENGHIGFNEPFSSFESETRVVDLTDSTIKANSQHFDNIEDVPKQAISMGLASIMSAKRIILIAFGSNKQKAIQQLMDGKVSESLPASILHQHPNVEIIVDDAVLN